MSDAPNIRVLGAGEWRTYKNLRLRALAEAPEAFGATLAQEEGRSEVEWAGSLAAVETGWSLPLVAEVDGVPMGLAWGVIDPAAPEVAKLFQMWVDPAYRGLGAGRMLVEVVVGWARAKKAAVVELGVTCGDRPARRLYERAGFVVSSEPKPMRHNPEWSAQRMRLALGPAG